MKNTIIKFITLFIGFIGFVLLTSFGLALTAILLVVGFVAKPFLLKKIKQQLSQVQVQKTTDSTAGIVYEGKCERVNE